MRRQIGFQELLVGRRADAPRVFRADGADLYLRTDPTGRPELVQLSCRIPELRCEVALDWTPQRGFRMAEVDDGEPSGLGYKATPVLRRARVDPGVARARVRSYLERHREGLPDEVAELLLTEL